jgi:glucoamylase
MEAPACSTPAFGAPGMTPRWTRGAKDAVGTAYSASSRVWFTLAQGTLTEMYYPTVDRPQVRDFQLLITDGTTFFHGERRDCDSATEVLSDVALGFDVTTRDREGRYTLRKQILADPHLSCVLIQTRLEVAPALARHLRLFLLCAPHLDGGGWHNNAVLASSAGRHLLLAHREGTWLAIAASVGLAHRSAGYVGASDGWTDLARNLRPTWSFDCALDGNVALCAELDLRAGNTAGGVNGKSFTVGIGFGDTQHAAVNAVLQGLGQPFEDSRARFLEQWERTRAHRLPLEKQSSDGGQLYHRSISLLLAHEDKTYPGALIASLSIPWGEAKGDEDLGGYHLVWTRDLVQSATGLLASGDRLTARRALIYLATSQHPDGGFAQNFWINGTPYWQGIQLDEVAFPIVLAWRLRQREGLDGFDPYPMVARAAGYLMRHGPATQQERWEEAGGYSPSSLAVQIASLVCASEFAQQAGDDALAALCLEYADFLEAHLEAWTVTTKGSLLAGVPRHYIRINPAPLAGPNAGEDPDEAILHINNQAPGAPDAFPARDIVDAGFLELVRYGVRPAGDELIEASLRVVDAVLKVATPFGPCWRRYNHDGYGQRPDGGAFTGWGQGRPWPLLTGERAHYELAAGRDVSGYIGAMERLANHLNMLPEQVWDEPDRPGQFLWAGRPTGSAMPLMWAHAEYLRLLRSRGDGAIFDLVPAVAARYCRRRAPHPPLEVWKLHRQVAAVAPGTKLRIQLESAFFLHASRDQWATIEEIRSTATNCGFEYVDIMLGAQQRAPFRFTFRYVKDGRWQGRDFEVGISTK